MMLLVFFIASKVACQDVCENKTFEIASIPSTNTVPFKRLYHVMDYNSKTNQLIIFGGRQDITTSFNDLWVFDINTSTYTLCYPSSDFIPAARSYGGGFVDESTNIFYIFGGATNQGPQNDMWSFELDTYNWRRVNSKGKVPSYRYRFGYTKFNWNNTFYFGVFGGNAITGQSNELYLYDVKNNTWVLKNNTSNAPILNITGTGLEYYNGCLYVATGTLSTTESTTFDKLYQYSLKNSTWTIINTVNSYVPRYYSQTAIINSTLYLIYGWSDTLQADVEDISYIDLNTLSQWKTLNTANCFARDSFTAKSNSSAIYIFGGYYTFDTNNGDYLNDLVVLSPDNWTCVQINDKYNVPPARQYHSVSAINGEIYIFGGLSLDGNLGDMWKFTRENIWVSVAATGSIPSARNGHAYASNGDIIVIWGGESKAGLLNDLYIFSAFDKNWQQLIPIGISPSSKSQACLAMKLPVIYIFGGYSNGGQSNELWVYYTANNTYSQIDAEKPPDPRYQTYCEIVDDVLWVMLGTGSSDIPSTDIYKFYLVNWTWAPFESSNVISSSSLGVVKHFDKFILSLGGEKYTTDPVQSVIIINITSANASCIGSIPIYYYAGGFTLIETTLFFHGGGSLLGSNLRLSIASIGFYSFDLKAIPEFNQICSPGSFYNANSQKCEQCRAGFYSDGYYNTDCTPCPKGTYNPNTGASSATQCYPCAYGSYSNSTGSTYCLQCPIGKKCPIGSTEFYDDVIADTIVSKQPKDYSADTEAISMKQKIIYAVIGGFGFIILILLFSFSKLKYSLTKIDVFYDQHCYELEIPIVLVQNIKGGLFFLFFILAAGLIISVSVLAYTENNIIEEKTLRPMAVLDQMVSHISADISMEIELINYGAACQTTDDISLYMKSTLIQSSQISYFLNKSSSSCFIKANCSNCEISVGDYISLSSYQAKSYCSGFSVSITSESSIPGSESMMKATLNSESDKVFRGYNQTTFTFTMTPSYFQSYISDYGDSTGYHVSVDANPTSGTQYKISEISFVSGLILRVDLVKNNDGLYTERHYKQTIITFLSTLLGSVFGIMGAVNGVLRVFENTMTNIKNKLKQKGEFDDMKEQRNKFKEILGDDLDDFSEKKSDESGSLNHGTNSRTSR